MPSSLVHHPLTRRRVVASAGAVGLAAAVTGLTDGAAPSYAGTRHHDAHHDRHRPDPTAPKRQLRAEWIATVANIDWPSAPGLPSAQQQAELVAYYDEAVARGLNAVIVQVRPTADAFWPGALEPWSVWLTGSQGTDPGYDPLGFAIEQAHARDLDFHAWFNPYRVSTSDDVDALVPDHPARVHPDWRISYGGQLYYDPGVPDARRFVEDAIMDAVVRYDLDAVHFDDYFYPYPVAGQAFPDDASFAAYGDGYTDRGDWRRHNTDLLVTELGSRIHRAKPWVRFGVSPFAVWRNAATDPRGSATTAGAQTYDDLYADTRRWVQEEWLDYIAPQVYWNIGFAPADYAVLVPWWSEQVDGTDVQLFIGQATYKVGTSTQDPAWSDPAEMTKHLTFNQDWPQVQGDMYFSAKDVHADRLGNVDLVQADHYRHPALIPVTPGVPGRSPASPRWLRARRTTTGVELDWSGCGTSYAVYRLPLPDRHDRHGRRRIGRCDLADATYLVATVRGVDGRRQTWTDTGAVAGSSYTYLVTALDRAFRESRPGRPVTVRG